MRGRSCTQPFLVEKSACRPDALLLPPRWANRSPPHPTRLRRPTFPPRGRLWGWEGPFSSAKPPLPARPAGGRAVTGVRYRAAGQAEKRENPRRVLQTRAGSPEGRTSPLWPSFPPFLGRNGGPRRVGALRGAAPRGTGKAPPTRRVRSTAPQAPGPTWRAQGRRPQKINLQTSIFNSIIKSR